jgi:hypothetical protein
MQPVRARRKSNQTVETGSADRTPIPRQKRWWNAADSRPTRDTPIQDLDDRAVNCAARGRLSLLINASEDFERRKRWHAWKDRYRLHRRITCLPCGLHKGVASADSLDQPRPDDHDHARITRRPHRRLSHIPWCPRSTRAQAAGHTCFTAQRIGPEPITCDKHHWHTGSSRRFGIAVASCEQKYQRCCGRASGTRDAATIRITHRPATQ